jgi:hypothetical protein
MKVPEARFHCGYRKHRSTQIEPTPFSAVAERLIQLSDEPLCVYAKRSAERPQFNHINAPLSTFALRNERLGLTDPPGEFHLRKAGALAGIAKGLEEDRVLV